MAGKFSSLLRGLAFLTCIAALTAGQWLFNGSDRARWDEGWWYMLAALAATLVFSIGRRMPDQLEPTQPQWGWTRSVWRVVLATICIAGALTWGAYATHALSVDYDPNFDFAWLSWFGATALFSLGLRLLQVRLGPSELPMARWEWLALAACFAVAIGFHLGNFQNFPPPDAVSQIEELQTGNFGLAYLQGSRNRWEFASWAVVAAAAIKLGGTNLFSVRLGFALINVLKIIPAFFLFRALGGRAVAIFGTLMLAVCGWDSILTRIPTHPDHLVTMIGLAMMAGPAVRGCWAVYPWVGLFSGFTSWSYIVFRPFIGFALAGSALSAWAQPGGTHLRKFLRSCVAMLIIAVCTVAVFYPLTHKLQGRFMHEYLDGWNRAVAQTAYYTPDDTWQNAFHKRWERISRVANLFYTVGDENPTHNPDARPTIDPVAGSLAVLGVGYCIARCLQGFYALALGAMVVTITGTLIATGNLDCLRGQAAINYVYTVIAIGAGAFLTGAHTAFGIIGRRLATLVLSLAVGFAAYWNGNLLHDLWTSPLTREHYRNDIAYLSDWLRVNATDIHVVGLIPSSANVVFGPNDGAWLRGPDVHGEPAWDVQSAWERMRAQRNPFMFLIAAPTMNRDIINYFETMLPSAQFMIREENTVHGVRMGSAKVDPANADLDGERLRRERCTGVRARFSFKYKNGTTTPPLNVIVPFIDGSTWPGQLRVQSYRDYDVLDHVDASWESDFVIPEESAGDYTIRAAPYEGTVLTVIDGHAIPTIGLAHLGPGTHHFESHGTFRPAAVEQSMQVSWQKNNDPPHLLPFYRFTEVDAGCLSSMAAAPPPPPPSPAEGE